MQKPPVLCCLLALVACLQTPIAAAGNPSPGIAGSWRLDSTRSPETAPGGWSSVSLEIKVEGDSVTVQRTFGAGRRVYVDAISFDTSRPETVLPMAWWPDNRMISASIGGDGTRRVKASWIDGRRTLRLNCDLVLDSQQGARAVNILSDYKVSAAGNELTLTELRSTRNRPVVWVFKRATP